MGEQDKQFKDFWTASSLDRFNVQKFASQLNAYDSDDKELLLEFPEEAFALPRPNTRLNKLAQKRVSNRVFSGDQLSLKELGLIFSSFYAWNGLEHRGYPSAGATYATELFAVGFNVEHLSGKVLYYDPEKHGLVALNGVAPSWEQASESLNISVEGTPSLLLVFVSFPERATAKYGERGGRFALLEAGAAIQQVSLQLAGAPKLKGVAVGGMLDQTWIDYLQLQNTDAHITLGYLVGK